MNILEFLNHKNKIPLVPIMSQKDFESLPHSKRVVLTCNQIGCSNMISSRGILCVKHSKKSDEWISNLESLLKAGKNEMKSQEINWKIYVDTDVESKIKSIFKSISEEKIPMQLALIEPYEKGEIKAKIVAKSYNIDFRTFEEICFDTLENGQKLAKFWTFSRKYDREFDAVAQPESIQIFGVKAISVSIEL